MEDYTINTAIAFNYQPLPLGAMRGDYAACVASVASATATYKQTDGLTVEVCVRSLEYDGAAVACYAVVRDKKGADISFAIDEFFYDVDDGLVSGLDRLLDEVYLMVYYREEKLNGASKLATPAEAWGRVVTAFLRCSNAAQRELCRFYGIE